MAANVQYRSAAEWASVNPVLALGDIAVTKESGLVKVGDAATAWASLTYLPQPVGNLLKEYATPNTDTAVKAVLGLGTITAAGLALSAGATAKAQRATLSTPLMNVSAATAPAVTDDIDLGYVPGDLWLRVSTGKLYVCVSNGDGAANWQILN
jgi:hypothetical protein